MRDDIKEVLVKVRNGIIDREERAISSFGTLSKNAVRKTPETLVQRKYDRRLDFSRDADRILGSLAYTRYIDKTQVFLRCINDHITHRVLHVQILSKIARDVGISLGLNTDLIEAIALGHDVGHAPFGHLGEKAIREICEKYSIPPFQHNVQSVRLLRNIERWNLCLQTYDGILCHDGEIHDEELRPNKQKDWEVFEKELKAKSGNPKMVLRPMTLEGCVVRFCDTISYIGRDIDDAITLKLIRSEDVPNELGDGSTEITWTLVNDLVCNSYGKDFIRFSSTTARGLKELKEFNYERIYRDERIIGKYEAIRDMFEELFRRVIVDLENDTDFTHVFSDHIKVIRDQCRGGKKYETNPNMYLQIALDFIAGMTDDYFAERIKELFPELYNRMPEPYMYFETT